MENVAHAPEEREREKDIYISLLQNMKKERRWKLSLILSINQTDLTMLNGRMLFINKYYLGY